MSDKETAEKLFDEIFGQHEGCYCEGRHGSDLSISAIERALIDARERGRGETAALVEAGNSLRREVSGLGAFEDAVRDAISNTNWSVLQLKGEAMKKALAPFEEEK